MNKPELAAFLRTRRARLLPGDVGLPAGPRRRTPGLRREEVAVLAHISTEYYVRLEQGRAPRPSADVLAGIAGALRLTASESDHLHLLAGTAPNRTAVHRRDVRPSIRALLTRLPRTAGFVMSAAFEVLAFNDLAASLMANFTERNLARRAFQPQEINPDLPYGISDATEFRRQVASELRGAVERYPTDLAIAALVDDLRATGPEFATLWDRRDVHPAAIGEITLDRDALHLPDRDQHLVLYSAPAHSPAAEALAFLDALGAEGQGVPGPADAASRVRNWSGSSGSA